MPPTDDTQSPSDPHGLRRFLEAQTGVHEKALSEIGGGQKRSHWMWFIFPQIDGLGMSPTSRLYAIKSLEEAKAYLDHPILGPRLLACAEAALSVKAKSAHDIFGSSDDLKLKSSATLFAQITPAGSVFHRLLEKFFNGQQDQRTLELLGPLTKQDPSR